MVDNTIAHSLAQQPLITKEVLLGVAPHCDAETLAPAIWSACLERLINTPLRCSHFLSQICTESAGLTVFTENLNYSTRRLCQVWPGRFPDLIAAQPYANNPQALAEHVYQGRLGNNQPGDGWRFIGRGALQITGRDNYAKFGEILKVDLIAHPEKAVEPVTSSRLAAAFWAAHDLNKSADVDDILAITLAVNGSRQSLDARKAALVTAKAALGVPA